MSKLYVTLTKSPIGYKQDQKDTVKAMGLKKRNQTVLLPDNESVRGMIFKVKHLVTVQEVAEDATQEA